MKTLESSRAADEETHLSYLLKKLSDSKLCSNMAFAALVSLSHTTDLILNRDKSPFSADERDLITSVREYLNFLICFLEDFPEKANRFEGKIRDLANKAEDLIEFFMWKKIRLSWWSVEQSRAEFGYLLKEATEEIGLIAGELMEDRPGYLPGSVPLSSWAPTCENDDRVIGLDGDLLAIKGRLCGESCKLEIIPIVGMGGIGKTTLARYAYDDALIMEHFQIRVWITVSQQYSASKILEGILDSMKWIDNIKLERNDELKKAESNESNVAEMAEKVYETLKGRRNELQITEMKERVYKNLKGKRYLFVMDDIWRTDVWDDVRNILPDDSNGSRIMLTTRLSDVAAYVDSGSPLHVMQAMSEIQGWKLLKSKVFTNNQDYCPPYLEDVGKGIARSCGGLPLAIVVVAGVLSTVDRDRVSWIEIAEDVKTVLLLQEEKGKQRRYLL